MSHSLSDLHLHVEHAARGPRPAAYTLPAERLLLLVRAAVQLGFASHDDHFRHHRGAGWDTCRDSSCAARRRLLDEIEAVPDWNAPDVVKAGVHRADRSLQVVHEHKLVPAGLVAHDVAVGATVLGRTERHHDVVYACACGEVFRVGVPDLHATFRADGSVLVEP